MTQVFEPHGVDSDRVDVGQRRWRPMVASAVAGLLIGGALGGFYAQRHPVTYRASTAVSVLPDATLSAAPSQNTTTLDASTYIQSQLVTLNGAPLLESVQKQLALVTRPQVTSTEVGQTYVVQVTATASTSAQANSIATAMAASYKAQRAAQFTAKVNTSLASTARQLTSVQARLSAAESATPAKLGVTPSETALQTQFESLLAAQSALSTSLSQAGQLVTVLTPVGLSAEKVSASRKDAVGGAFLGAIIALALLTLFRRSARRVRSVGDIADLGVPVLLPVVERRGLRTRRSSTFWTSPEARLLASRLTTAGLERPEPIVVLGATSKVGASFVATSLATSLVRRGRVLLVTAKSRTAPNERLDTGLAGTGSDDVEQLIVPSSVSDLWLLPFDYQAQDSTGSRSAVAVLADLIAQAGARGWLVVVDAPALSDSDVAVELTPVDGIAALVVGRDRSRPADVLSAFELFQARGRRLQGAILNDVPRWSLGAGRTLALDEGGTGPHQPDRVESSAAQARAVATLAFADDSRAGATAVSATTAKPATAKPATATTATAVVQQQYEPSAPGRELAGAASDAVAPRANRPRHNRYRSAEPAQGVARTTPRRKP